MAKMSVEGAVLAALQELGRVFGEDRVMNAAGQALQGAARTKAAVDHNVSTVLSLAGLPSKADLDALRRQVDLLQVSVAGLQRKIDRLLEAAAHEHDGGAPGRRRRTPPSQS